MYAQDEALSDALARHGKLVDWMVFIDMDESVVSDESIPGLCRWLESRGYDGGLMEDRPMPTRLDNLDRYVIETNLGYGGPYRVAPKYMCDTRRVYSTRTSIVFRSRGRQYRFDPRRLFFLHYKMPSRHPDMRDCFEEVDTGISSGLIDGVQVVGRRALQPRMALKSRSPGLETNHGGGLPVVAPRRVQAYHKSAGVLAWPHQPQGIAVYVDL